MSNSRNSDCYLLRTNVSVEMIHTVSTLPCQVFVNRCPQDSFPYQFITLKLYLLDKWIPQNLCPRRSWACFRYPPAPHLLTRMQKPRGKSMLCSQYLHRGQQQCTWPGAKCSVAVNGCISIWISAKVLPERGCEGGGCSGFQRGAAAPYASHGGVAMGLHRGGGPLCGYCSSHSMVGWMMFTRTQTMGGGQGPTWSPHRP